jgi:hypothetical protein
MSNPAASDQAVLQSMPPGSQISTPAPVHGPAAGPTPEIELDKSAPVVRSMLKVPLQTSVHTVELSAAGAQLSATPANVTLATLSACATGMKNRSATAAIPSFMVLSIRQDATLSEVVVSISNHLRLGQLSVYDE